uniref:Chemokine interleukin-8-like domain-containing protein n=1 Tax=Pundamilia nyererei TaxID=303518 RepID=A0A3B4FM89_9CICH
MLNSGSLSVLLCTVLVVLNGVKLATCCTTVTNKEITEPILGYLVQRANQPCVNASGVFCINGRAPWVRAKIVKMTDGETFSGMQEEVNTPILKTWSKDVSAMSYYFQ